MNIYVGNLSRDIAEEDLRGAFEAFGRVASVNLITEKSSGEPRGFAFVEMPAKTEAQSAINDLNGTGLKGRELKTTRLAPAPKGVEAEAAEVVEGGAAEEEAGVGEPRSWYTALGHQRLLRRRQSTLL